MNSKKESSDYKKKKKQQPTKILKQRKFMLPD